MNKKITLIIHAIIITMFFSCTTEMTIKDDYIYSPVSHLKYKYPLNVTVDGDYKCNKIKFKDDIIDIYIKELESRKLFAGIDRKDVSKSNVLIEIVYTEEESESKRGMTISTTMKQLPENKLIYKEKDFQEGSVNCFKKSDEFAVMLKKLNNSSINSIDARFAQYTKEGNLPVTLSKKEVICAIFKFNDTVPNEQYGEAVVSMLTANLTKTENIKLVERERIQKAIKELEFQTSGMSDTNTAKEVGKFLNSDYIIFGGISKLKDTYLIALNVIDVKSGQIVISRNSENKDPNKFTEAIQQQANYISQFITK